MNSKYTREAQEIKQTKKTSTVMEKALGPDIEGNASSSSTPVSITSTQEFDVKATKRLLRKIDRHVLPIMCIICLLVIGPLESR